MWPRHKSSPIARQGAASVAEEFIAALPTGGKYIELTGKESDTNAGVRSTAYASVISHRPELVQVAKETANWSQDEAFKKVETLLQRDRDIQGIIAGNDTMALGAVAAIKSGKLTTTGLQSAVLISQMAVQQADSFIKTGKAGKDEKQSIDCVVINSKNAENYTTFALK